MSKSKATITKVAESYMNDLKRQFPGTETDAILDAFDIADVWVRVELPPELDEAYMDVLDATVRLNNEYWEKTGVQVIATVGDREPAFS